MAGSFHKLAVLAAALHLTAAAHAPDEPLPIELEYASLSIDGQTNQVHIREPRITQGDDLRIEAGEAFATDIGFNKAEWTLSGGVRIETASITIQAATAEFAFEDLELTRTELAGSPASFTDSGAAGGRQPVTGTAATIFYDVAEHQLRLLGDIRLERENGVLVSCDLIYDFDDGSIRAGTADCPEQSRFRYIRRADAENSDSDP